MTWREISPPPVRATYTFAFPRAHPSPQPLYLQVWPAALPLTADSLKLQKPLPADVTLSPFYRLVLRLLQAAQDPEYTDWMYTLPQTLGLVPSAWNAAQLKLLNLVNPYIAGRALEQRKEHTQVCAG